MGRPIKEPTGSSFRQTAARVLEIESLAVAKLADRLVAMYFEDVLLDYGYDVEESDFPRWRKFHASEDIYGYIANRLLFTKPVRKLI